MTDKKKSLQRKILEPLYDKSVTCLYCNHKFKSKQVRSSMAKVIKQDSDYCTYYEGENPIFYDVFVCPSCGFAFTNSFSRITPSRKEKIEKNYLKNLSAVPQLCGERDDFDALRAYKLASLAAYVINEKKSLVGNLFLRIAWMYRYQNDIDNEKEYLEKALRFYLDAYQRGNIHDFVMEEHQLLFLMGDIYIRLGKNNEATKIFSKLLSDRGVSQKIRTRASEVWNEYRERQKENKE